MVEIPPLAEVPDGGRDAESSDAGSELGDAHDASNDVDDGDVLNDAAEAAEASVCGANQKLCDGTCVPVDDPGFGCAQPDCSPCSENHATRGCAAGACVILECTEGWDDCDMSPTNGCEAELASDGSNCGQCGYDCGGAACSDAVCGVITVAMGLPQCWSVAVDDTHAYVTVVDGADNLYRVPKSGGIPTSVVPGAEPGEGEVVVEDTYLYWANRTVGQVRRVNKAGGTPSVLGASPVPKHLALDAGEIYWTDFGVSDADGALYRAPKQPGGSTTLVASGFRTPAGLALVGLDVFVVGRDDGSLTRVAKDGGVIDIVDPGDPGWFQGWSVLRDGNEVLWASAPDLMAIEGMTSLVPLLLGGMEHPRVMVLDEGQLFWCSLEGPLQELRYVQRSSLPGGSWRVLASGLGCHGVAVDDDFVYFTSYTDIASADGGILKVGRPPRP